MNILGSPALTLDYRLLAHPVIKPSMKAYSQNLKVFLPDCMDLFNDVFLKAKNIKLNYIYI